MTNVQALDNIETWLTSNGRLAGYNVRKFRYSADDLVSNLPLCLLRYSGQGINNSNIEEMDFYIVLLGDSSSLRTISNEARAIHNLARSTVYPSGVVKCRTIVMPNDPVEMENSVFSVSMQIRLTIEV